MGPTASIPVGGRSARQEVEAPASPAALLGLVGAFFGLLFLRAPDILLHAGLWGEEGRILYPDAYNAGLASLLWPGGGYLDTYSRLVALAVQPLPLIYVPSRSAVWLHSGPLMARSPAPTSTSVRLFAA